MENIERSSKPSFVKKLLAGGDQEHVNEKRHTLGGDKKRKSKVKGRNKAKTFMNKDRERIKKSGESLLSESGEGIEEETKVIVNPETADLREDNVEMEIKQSLTPEEKLKKFEEMKKNSGVSGGGRRTFVHTRKSKRESPSRGRGKTFANKLVEGDVIEEEPVPRDVLVHEYRDSRNGPTDQHSKSILFYNFQDQTKLRKWN
jgi:hypothetical protein